MKLIFTKRSNIYVSLVVILFLITGCRDKYETRITVEGIYYPNEPITIYGRRAKWLGGLSPTNAYIYGPTRVSELGTMKFAEIGPQNGRRAEVARMEFSKSSIYIETAWLSKYGHLDYSERKPTLKDWIRHHPLWTIILFIILFILLVLYVRYEVRSHNKFQKFKPNK